MNKGVNLTAKKDSVDINLFSEVLDLISEEEACEYHDNFSPLPFRIWNTVLFWKVAILN